MEVPQPSYQQTSSTPPVKPIWETTLAFPYGNSHTRRRSAAHALTGRGSGSEQKELGQSAAKRRKQRKIPAHATRSKECSVCWRPAGGKEARSRGTKPTERDSCVRCPLCRPSNPQLTAAGLDWSVPRRFGVTSCGPPSRV
jgi:hypothetical protein